MNRLNRVHENISGRLARLAIVVVLALLAAGCGSQPARFHLDMVHIRNNDTPDSPFTRAQIQNLADVMTALFGTPDKPHLLANSGINLHGLMDMEKLQMAAGPVGSDQDGMPHGLYRRHCAHCHGTSGDGAGPTAPFLNPYPRDYRMGIYKFKSTPKGEKPTDADLERIVRNGIQGTAMPSFNLLPDDEVLALIDYVKYLSIRGEVERNLVLELSDMDEGDLLVDGEDMEDGLDRVRGTVSMISTRWQRAESMVLRPSPRPALATADEIQQSLQRGRKLFHGVVANCFSCHGDTALGDGQLDLYDDWTEQLDPKNKENMNELLAVAGPRRSWMTPRHIRPRNLRLGVYRGGRRPLDIYWRIRNGIDGAKMPAVAVIAADASPDEKGLTEEEVWHLIHYVRSLPYDPLSRPPYEVHEHAPQRERPL